MIISVLSELAGIYPLLMKHVEQEPGPGGAYVDVGCAAGLAWAQADEEDDVGFQAFEGADGGKANCVGAGVVEVAKGPVTEVGLINEAAALFGVRGEDNDTFGLDALVDQATQFAAD